MATLIRVKGKNRERSMPRAFERVGSFLPYRLLAEIESMCVASGRFEQLQEIRLRAGRRVYLTLGGVGGKRNIALSTVLSAIEISEMLDRMCDGSLYAFSESIIKGYVSLGDGIRVGVCGRASVEDGKVLGVYGISALNIRLPCECLQVDEVLLRRIKECLLGGEGVLIYSPPAQGKTTLLRSLGRMLACGSLPMRVALIDSREEFGDYSDRDELSLDILSGYPKAEGIRIATAFMNPQVIICDEIGSEEEAVAIAQAQNCGVPLIASAHGSSAENLLKRRGMLELHEAGTFGIYVGLRIGVDRGFEYKIQKREELFCT